MCLRLCKKLCTTFLAEGRKRSLSGLWYCWSNQLPSFLACRLLLDTIFHRLFLGCCMGKDGLIQTLYHRCKFIQCYYHFLALMESWRLFYSQRVGNHSKIINISQFSQQLSTFYSASIWFNFSIWAPSHSFWQILHRWLLELLYLGIWRSKSTLVWRILFYK